MELGEWIGGQIIENSDNRGSDNRGSTGTTGWIFLKKRQKFGHGSI